MCLVQGRADLTDGAELCRNVFFVRARLCLTRNTEMFAVCVGYDELG